VYHTHERAANAAAIRCAVVSTGAGMDSWVLVDTVLDAESIFSARLRHLLSRDAHAHPVFDGATPVSFAYILYH